MNDLAIDLRDVAKTYGRRVHALRGVQMQVAAGEIFGLLGPNGAGKSTLVKIMMTVIRPTCWLALPGCFAVVIFERRSALLGEPSGGSILWSYPPRGEG